MDEINEWMKDIEMVKSGTIQVTLIRQNSIFNNEQNKSNRYNTTRRMDNQIT